MVQITCFFIGHRDAPPSVWPKIQEAVGQHIVRYGVTRFLVGHYGLFDRMAAAAVIKEKEKHPYVTLEILIPYHPAERSVALPEGFDSLYYPFSGESVPRRLAIVRANHAAIQQSQYLIAYARYPGNARNLLQYAQGRQAHGEIQVLNFAE